MEKLNKMFNGIYGWTVKALVDGMTDAGLWVDDNHEIIKYMTFEFGGLSQIKDKYKIEIEVEETDE